MHFIYSPTREIQLYFRSCMANSKRKFNLLCHKPSSSLKYIKVRTALRVFYLVLWFYLFLFLFGNRYERPRALQLLIKMLIRRCLKQEGRSLLQRRSSFKIDQSPKRLLTTYARRKCRALERTGSNQQSANSGLIVWYCISNNQSGSPA